MPNRVPFGGTGRSLFGDPTRTAQRRTPVATLGGTPTVPPTAEPVEPSSIFGGEPLRGPADDPFGFSGRGIGGAATPFSFDPSTTFFEPPPPPPLPLPPATLPTTPSPPTPPPPGGSQQTPPRTDFGGGNPQQQQRQIIDAMNGAVPIGFDPVKWRNPNHRTHKYLAGRVLMASGRVDDVLALPEFQGWSKLSEDKIRDPLGSIFDLYYDFGGTQQRVQWTQTHGPGGVPLGDPTAAAAPPTAPGAGGGSGGGGGAPGPTIPDWLRDWIGGEGPLGAFLPGGFSDESGDPLSALIDSATAGLITSGGQTPFSQSIADTLQRVIAQGGVSPDLTNRLVAAREAAALGQQALLEDARAALAAQGGLSTPGVEQGPTTAAVGRIAERIAPEFAGAVRDIFTDALDVSNRSFMDALSLATGMSDQQARLLLAAIGQGTSRQQVVAGIALDALALNQDWNKFLAQHNLDMKQLEEEIANGRLDRVIAIIRLYLEGADVAAGGFIG